MLLTSYLFENLKIYHPDILKKQLLTKITQQHKELYDRNNNRQLAYATVNHESLGKRPASEQCLSIPKLITMNSDFGKEGEKKIYLLSATVTL